MYISGEAELKILEDIILKRKFFRNQGKNVPTFCSRFEAEFAKKMDTSYSLLVTSGTNALVCALGSLNLMPGDEVIIPSYTFFATAAAVINVGATPIMANIDETLLIDLDEIKRLIGPKTKAIIAVHMDGHPCKMDEILKIATESNLVVIEDVAQAVGGKFKNRPLGSWGEFGCFSFNVDKIISAGEGGAVITNGRAQYERCLCLQDASCIFGATHKDSFQNIKPFIGQSMRVSELTGAIMSVQLSRLDEILFRLRARYKILVSCLKEAHLPVVVSNDEEGDCGTSVYLTFDSVEKIKIVLQKLNKDSLIAIPLAARPAHFSWQWSGLLTESRPHMQYHKSQFLTSIDIVSRTIKIEVPFEIEINEMEKYAQTIISKINNI